MYWQEIVRRESTKFRQNYGHIFNLAQVKRIIADFIVEGIFNENTHQLCL